MCAVDKRVHVGRMRGGGRGSEDEDKCLWEESACEEDEGEE